MTHHEPIREQEWALEDEDVVIVREETGSVSIVPRSVRKAPPEAREAITSMVRAAAAYEQALIELGATIETARDLGVSWDAVGWAVGVTGSGARKRWGS